MQFICKYVPFPYALFTNGLLVTQFVFIIIRENNRVPLYSLSPFWNSGQRWVIWEVCIRRELYIHEVLGTVTYVYWHARTCRVRVGLPM